MNNSWMPYLKARMALIKDCLREGQQPDEIYRRLQVDEIQVKLLCMTAKREMQLDDAEGSSH